VAKQTTIKLPHGYVPRDYQRPRYDYMLQDTRGLRALSCIHRRAGKDLTDWNITIAKAHQRIGIYYYFLPTYAQGKKVVWDGIDGGGRKLLDYIPKQLIAGKNGTEMKVDLVVGSLIQVVGTDNFDSIMGTNPVGCVFSDYALQDPSAWDFIRPILRENGGWAMFNFTPRGMNHAYNLYRMAIENPSWFAERKTILDTGALSLEDIEEERKAGMPENIIRQEYYCDFSSSDDNVLVPLHLIESAVGRQVSYAYAMPVAGLDLGYSLDGDPTALVIRQGGRILHIAECQKNDYREIAGWTSNLLQQFDCRNVAIDAIGWGAGVKQPLEELGYEVVAVNVAESAPTAERFSRLRDELWFRCREWFEAKQNCLPEELPLKGKLISELSGVTYEFTSATSRIKVQSKKEMKKDGKQSPNIADALCLTFAIPDEQIMKHYRDTPEKKNFIAA
jgi:hypothetical protein